MKKALLVAALIAAFATQVYAGLLPKNPPPKGLKTYTVATLPAAATKTNLAVIVTDGAAAGDCTTGSGTTRNVCISNGSAWAAVGDGTGGDASISDAAFGAGWNGDTTHAPSKNAIYDAFGGWAAVSATDPSFTSVTATGAGGLVSGVANVTQGFLKLYTNLDAVYFFGLSGGAQLTESVGWRVPVAMPTVANSLVNIQPTTGQLGYTSPATFQAAMASASQAEMEAGTEAGLRAMSPLRVAQAIAALAGAASGDVASVGDCASGACLDGTSDGGTYIRLYDGNSHYTQLAAGDSTGNLTFTFPTAAPAGNNYIMVMSTTGAISTRADTTYQPLAANLTNIAGITGVQGDVLYFNGTAWVALGAGISGQYLQTQGAGANPQWASTAVSGDIEKVGDCSSGNCFDGTSGGNSLVFEGATANDFEITLTAADPGADYTVTIPAGTGTIVLGPADYTADNRLIRTDYGAGKLTLTQITGISVDDSDNISGVVGLASTSLSPSSHIAIGADPADAGAVRLSNATYIMSEAAPAGTDISVIGVDSGEIIQIGASGASGVTITPALTASGLITANAGITVATGQNLTLTGLSGLLKATAGVVSGSATLDDIGEGTTYKRVLAGNVDANLNVARLYVAAGAGYITVTGPTQARAITLDDAAQELAARNRANTFTENQIFGNADTDTVSIRGLLLGADRTGSNDAVQIAATLATATYATGTNELYVAGDVEVGGTVYSTGGFVSTAAPGSPSYISLQNNSGGYTPAAGEYSFYFETDGSNKARVSINGSEKELINDSDAQTVGGAKTFTAAAAIQNTLTLSNGASAAQLIMKEASGGGTETITIQTGNVTTGYTVTLPTAQGANGTVMTNNGSGVLSWTTPTATAHGSDTFVQFNDGGSALGSDAGFTWNKTTNALTLGTEGQDGSLVLYNELGGTDYSATIIPNGSQAAAATITLPAATGTLATLGNQETFSGVKTFSAIPVFAVGISVQNGSTGAGFVRLYEDSDNGTDYSILTGAADAGASPAFVFGGSAANSESLTLTLGANDNTATWSTTTGVTSLSFSAISLATTGAILGGINTITTSSNPYSLSAANAYGSVIFYGATGEVDLPAGAAGMAIMVMNTTAGTTTIDPNGTEVIVRDGTTQSAGVSITITGGAGKFVSLIHDGTNWRTAGYSGTLAQGS